MHRSGATPPTVCVVMPAFNEASAIEMVIPQMWSQLGRQDVQLVVVDDASRDDTASRVRSLASSGVPVTLVTNASNRVHGPSTLHALTLGLASGVDIVISMDSDGECPAEEVALVARAIFAGSADVVEGVRRGRQQPWFRRAVSIATSILVWQRCGRWPGDANTPIRAYRRDSLSLLLSDVPENAMTPNLYLSVLARRRAVTIREVLVNCQPTPSSRGLGSTWGTRNRFVPNAVLMTFCLRAARQWMAMG